jgi:hypothetical protein
MESIIGALENFLKEQPFKGRLAEIIGRRAITDVDGRIDQEATVIMSAAYMSAFESLKNADGERLRGDHLERLGMKFGDRDGVEIPLAESKEDESLRKYHWSC